MSWLARLKKLNGPDPHPTKPTKPGFVGFVGTPQGPFQKSNSEVGAPPKLVIVRGNPAPATEPAPPHVFNLPDSVRALLGVDDGEITRMVGYATQARRHGLNVDDAEEIADRLTLRDRQHDDRRMCIECRCLELSGRCAAARAGQLAGVDRRHEPVKTALMRCAGFTPNTRTTP
jgi:hypothetical protein